MKRSCPESELHASRKRIFVGLLSLTFALIILIILGGGWVATIGLEHLHPRLPLLAQILAAISCFILGGIITTLILSIIFERELPFTKRIRGLGVKMFLPMMEILAPRLGVDRDRVRNSFIEINNRMLISENRGRISPERLLLLLPHCLQQSDCSRRITVDLENCRRCGRCDIDKLLELAGHYRVHIAVATGGTLARKIVRDHRPHMIIAVACERDLTSGIHDTYPLPVFGVLNQRPQGPCWNTRVDVREVEKALRLFLRPTSLPPEPLPCR